MPPLTFIDLKGLRSIRRQRLWRKWVRTPDGCDPKARSNPSEECDGPVLGLLTKRLRQLRPVIELEDPYLVAVMIALAQKRRKQDSQAGRASNCDGLAELGPHSTVESSAPCSTHQTECKRPFEVCPPCPSKEL